jgi:hypothetical protein
LPSGASETSAEAQPQDLASFSKRSLLTWAHGAQSGLPDAPIQEKFAGTMRLRRCSAFVRSRDADPDSGREMTITEFTQDRGCNTFFITRELA